MTGDGIMALFGAPVALEEAPQRAIRASLSIHREMATLTDRLRKTRDDLPPIRMRIGIHTGPIVVGSLGDDLRVEFKAVGDTVVLAARLEQIAEAGQIFPLCCISLRNQRNDIFRFPNSKTFFTID